MKSALGGKYNIMSKKGYKHTTEHNAKIKSNHARYWFGKKRFISQETKNKMSKMAKELGRVPPSRKGVKASLETRIKMSNSRKGSKNHFWRGGITSVSVAIRGSFEYKLWRDTVFERDGYTCIWCGIKSGQGKAVILHADHIKPFSLYPELRFAIDNGRTLCIDCHKTTETYGGKMNKIKWKL